MKNNYFIVFCFFLAFLTVTCKTSKEPVDPKSSLKEIVQLPTITGLNGTSSSYDANTFTYTVNVPFGTNVKSLIVYLEVSSGASISPNPSTARDYTNPVVYTVTAEDGSKQNYTVQVLQLAAPKSSEKQITNFEFANLSPVVSASINQSTYKITASVPSQVDLTKLIPTIKLSNKATVTPSPGVAQDFTKTVIYKVTAEDGSVQNYEVQVLKQATPYPTGLGCLISKIETDFAYCTFEYDELGRVMFMTLSGLTSANPGHLIRFKYDGSTNNLVEVDDNIGINIHREPFDITFKFKYSPGKIDILENRKGSTDYSTTFVTVDNENRMTQDDDRCALCSQFYCRTYAYSNGLMVQRKTCHRQARNMPESVISDLTYDNTSTKSFLYNQRNNPVFLYIYSYYMSIFRDSRLDILDDANPLIFPYGTTMPSKLTDVDDKSRVSVKYVNNSDGYPTQMQIDYEKGDVFLEKATFNLKLTYINCK